MNLHILFDTAENESETVALLAEEISSQVEKWKGISFGELLDTYVPVAVDFILRIVLALIIFAVGRKLIRWIIRLCDRTMERHGLEVTVRKFLRNVLTAACYTMLVLMIMQTVGLAATSLTAAFASAGVAIGLALQGSLSNFAGGILILLMKPFVIGDYIIQSENEGTVKEIGLVYTKLQTVDNRLVLIPNGKLADSSLINVSANPVRRLDLTVGISYGSDLKLAKEILRRLADGVTCRITDRPVEVFVSELADSSVNLGLRVWLPTGEYWTVKWQLTEQIKLEFDKAGVEIPYGQLDVHVDQK